MSSAASPSVHGAVSAIGVGTVLYVGVELLGDTPSCASTSDSPSSPPAQSLSPTSPAASPSSLERHLSAPLALNQGRNARLELYRGYLGENEGRAACNRVDRCTWIFYMRVCLFLFYLFSLPLFCLCCYSLDVCVRAYISRPQLSRSPLVAGFGRRVCVGHRALVHGRID